MHTFQCATIAAIFYISLFAGKIDAQYPAQLKIMTYNILAENATHTSGDYTDIATVIKAIKPNVCGMQKIDSLGVTANPIDVLKYLGEQTTMVPEFSMSYAKGGGAYGNGFLSDSIPKSTRRLAIPKGSASEDRSALEIGITMGGERVRVIVTHIDYQSAANRTAQLQQILPWIDAGGTATDPVVIMADFNAQPAESSMKLLTDAGFEFVKGNNGVILDSTQKINHILYRPVTRWKINDAGNPVYTAASNRNPLWADMELLDPVAVSVPPPARVMHTSPRLQLSGTTLRYRLAAEAGVSLQLYSASGRRAWSVLTNDRQQAGDHTIAVPYGNLPAGRYHCILSIDGRSYAATMAIVR